LSDDELEERSDASSPLCYKEIQSGKVRRNTTVWCH